MTGICTLIAKSAIVGKVHLTATLDNTRQRAGVI